jgi:hypothetical protein
LVIANKVAQSEPDAMRFLIGDIPRQDLVDMCFNVYDVSDTPTLFQRMAALYQEMGRDTEAAWALEKADQILHERREPVL